MARQKSTIAAAFALLAAAAFGAHPVDASCPDPGDAIGNALATRSAKVPQLSPLSPHPILKRTLITEGLSVDTLLTEDFDPSGSANSLSGSVENTPNIVQLAGGGYAAFVAQDNGFVSKIFINAEGVPYKIESRDMRRVACANDQITAAPAVHLSTYASAAFQAAYGDDLVYVATRYVDDGKMGCGNAAVDNVVYALYANPPDFATASPAWVFNDLGSVDMDVVYESPWLDYDNDRLIVASERTGSVTKHSLWSIDVITGTSAWSTNAGRLQTSPILRGNSIYVATRSGDVKSLSSLDGSAQWSENISPFPITTNLFAEFREPYTDLIGVVDFTGAIHMVVDNGSSGSLTWSSSLLSGANARSRLGFDAENGKLYVGGDDGDLHQLNLLTGVVEASRTVGTGVVGSASFVFEDTDANGSFDDVRVLAGSADGTITKFCYPWSVEAMPFAPDGEASPVSYAAPPSKPCGTTSDCGISPPNDCSTWICQNNVCVAQPVQDGKLCKDSYEFTVGDVCQSGVCAGKSECEQRFDVCSCIKDDGKQHNRVLWTVEAAKQAGESGVKCSKDAECREQLGEGFECLDGTCQKLPNEVVPVRATNTCLAMGAGGGAQTIVWLHLFDELRIPFDSKGLVVKFSLTGGGGATQPRFYNQETKATTEAKTVSTDDFVFKSPRAGTYYVVLLGPESGEPTGPTNPFVLTADVEFTDGTGQCINTADGIPEGKHLSPSSTHQVRISVGRADSAGCRLFGDTDETGHLSITIEDSRGDPVEGALVQLGRKGNKFAFFSTFANFLGGKGPDAPNFQKTNSKGQVVFRDMGNNMNGSNANKETPTFPVFVTCPNGTKFDFNADSAVHTENRC